PTSHALFLCFTATSPTEIYTLSLHDALPIFCSATPINSTNQAWREWLKGWASTKSSLTLVCPVANTRNKLNKTCRMGFALASKADRKSTRLNSSHVSISYAVFCLKKKNKHNP